MSLLPYVKTHFETYATRVKKLTPPSPLTPNNIATNAGEDRTPILPETRSNRRGLEKNACKKSPNTVRKRMRSKRTSK